MRVGIMGGTLDPIHNGHIQMAQAALETLGLDGVMLLPAGDPPHKERTTSKEDRMEMVRLAVMDKPGIFACGIEIGRSGTTYTVDSLKELREKNPDTEWIYIVGADTLNVLDTWRNFSEVAKLCTFAVCGRAEEEASKLRMEELRREFGANFLEMDFVGPDISSTDIRNRVQAGESIRDLVPTEVGKYIYDHGLYMTRYTRAEIIEKLRSSLKPSRFKHTIGVAETAVQLAEIHGANPARAELAALLHDCAKHLPLNELKTMALGCSGGIDDAELEAVNVLHAPAGAVYAKREYAVGDPEILSAIRKHTIGAPEMSLLDAIIYTADFIEPGREAFPGLREVRELARKDIYSAMCMCAELTNHYLEAQGRNAHSRSLEMLKHYKKNL